MASVKDIPLIIHNADAAMLLSNRFLSPVADRITFGFGSAMTQKYGVRAYVTGNPVREEIARLPPPELRFAGRSGPLQLLVVGGSLGARTLNRTLPAAMAMLNADERPRIVHQTGTADETSVRGAYANANVAADVVSFLDDMPARYASADVVLCRAGAITVSELAAAGVASILVPLTVSTTSHQRDNAAFMEESGGAIHVPQEQLTAGGLTQLFRTLNRERLLEMALAARAQAQPEATNRVATLCEDSVRETRASPR
jgi:UDP-N-acetylglucosamine--N-acetylmuramyl-(pentapeptide) pyrophosphoryl-undecaprenol N-acetylglucosamine transferase